MAMINGSSVPIRPVFTPSCDWIRTLTPPARVAVEISAGVRGHWWSHFGSDSRWIKRDTRGVNDAGRAGKQAEPKHTNMLTAEPSENIRECPDVITKEGKKPTIKGPTPCLLQ